MADVTQMLLGGLDVVSQIVIMIAILLVVGLFGLVFVYLSSWPHTVIARVITSGKEGNRGKFIKRFPARTVNKNGIITWQLRLRPLKHKEVTAPQPESIHLTKGGKYFAECYMYEGDDEPRWLMDTGDISDSFKSFSTEERALHVESVTRDITRRKKNALEILMQLAPMIGIIILVLGFFIFFENIAKPAQDMMKANQALMAQNAQISEQNARMVSVLAGKMEAGEIIIKQEFQAPPDAQPVGAGG